MDQIGPKMQLSLLCPALLEHHQIWQIGSTLLIEIVSGPGKLLLWSDLTQILNLGPTEGYDSIDFTLP